MSLEGQFDDDAGVVHVGHDARQRYHDSRGYGYPLEGNEIALAPVEAAHLLYRGDLDAVVETSTGDRLDFQAFVSREPGTDFGVRFLVYADLRERGFYLSPAREPWIDESLLDAEHERIDFAVFPRGKGPGDGELEYALRVIGERTDIPAAELADSVLAVVDEESEITYFDVNARNPSGETETDLPTGVEAALLEDRVVLWEPPIDLYEDAFYGQPLEGREYERPTLQCSLLEAAYLAERGVIDLAVETVVERGREVEGERFDRRLRVYTELREREIVPKTGYKFGADFRTYANVESVSELSHSELLVRVHPAGYIFEPRDLALDVRLAHGVRKTMVFALVGESDEDGEEATGLTDDSDDSNDSNDTDASDDTTDIEWWSLERLTP